MLLTPYAFILVALVAYRVTRFLVFDSLIGANLESGSSFSKWLDLFAYEPTGGDRSFIRGKIGDLLVCPFCTGFWVSLAVTCGWLWVAPWHLGRIGWLTVFAVAGVQSMAAAIDHRLTNCCPPARISAPATQKGAHLDRG